MNKKISVIIPVYNAEKYLSDTLNCILSQTHKNLEIICVLDMPTDNSEQIIKKYRYDSRIKIVRHKKNLGPSAARNNGVEHATGDYIHFMDSDDVINQTFYENLLKHIGNYDVATCSVFYESMPHQSVWIKKSKILLQDKEKFKKTDVMLQGWAWRYLISIKFWKKNKLSFQDLVPLEDRPVMVEMIHYANSVILCPDAWYFYKERTGSILNKKDDANIKKREENFKRSSNITKAFIKKHNIATPNCRWQYFKKRISNIGIRKILPFYFPNVNKPSKLTNIFANLISMFVSNKQSRTNLRNILWQGLFRSLYLIRKNEHETPKKFPHVLTVCAIVKNEPDLVEWIGFNQKAGIEKFYVYDNGSTDNIIERLAPYIKSGIVEYNYFPGEQMQALAYNDCLAKHKFDSKWMALIDADEFILSFVDLNKTLSELPDDASQLVFPWRCFGSNEHDTRPTNGIVKNYLHRATDEFSRMLRYGFKSIVNPRRIVSATAHIHFGFGKLYDANINEIKIENVAPRHNLPYDKIVLHHYWCKSRKDFEERWTKGDVLMRGGQRKTMDNSVFKLRDRNEVFDDSALKFYNEHPKSKGRK